MTLIDSQAALEEALEALAARDPVMARLIADGARPPLRKRPPGFAGLAWIVVAQQLSTASAQAIFGRLSHQLPTLSAPDIGGASDEALRAAGLSRAKIRTLRGIAAAISAGTLPLDALADMDGTQARRHLTAITGIGPWTADIYCLFCLGHPDAFPAGDLAVQEAARVTYSL